MLIESSSKDFHKLLQYRRLTALTPSCKLCRVVVVTIHLPVVLIIAVLRAEDCRTYAAGEVLDMIFPVERCYIGSTQRATTCMAQQVEASKVVGLAEWVCIFHLIIDREELLRDNCAAVLNRPSRQFHKLEL